MTRLQEAMAVVRANPKNSKAWAELGDLLLADGQHERAKQSYQRALQLDAANAAAQSGLMATLRTGSEWGGATQPPVAPEPPAPAALPSDEVSARSVVSSLPVTERAPSVPRASVRAASDIDTPAPKTVTVSAPSRAAPSRGAARTAPLRTPPPPPTKPSPARLWTGLLATLLLPLLCLCAGLALVIRTF